MLKLNSTIFTILKSINKSLVCCVIKFWWTKLRKKCPYSGGPHCVKSVLISTFAVLGVIRSETLNNTKRSGYCTRSFIKPACTVSGEIGFSSLN